MATIRQKKAFDKTLENGGNVSKAMSKSGYSKAMAKNPQKLTQSKGWQELMDKHLPDDLLAKVHREGLEAGKTVYKNNVTTGEMEEVGFEPDFSVRHKYLDSAYKLKGSYAPEKKLNVNLEINDEQKERAIKAIRQLSGGGDSK